MRRELSGFSIFCLLAVFLLTLPLGAIGQSDFPSFESLVARNVSLEAEGFMFASGLRPGEEGKPNGIGTEILPMKWCGSGFIVKDDGSIATNYHVTRRALRVKAIFEEGASFEIHHIKVYDPVSDIAVLKMRSSKRFAVVSLGDSDSVRPMDSVLAVGNSLCQRLAVTKGMVNQIIRDEKTGEVVAIRHSAPIAPGNSGGALYEGNNVVGINVASRPPFQIHYAVPINKLKTMLGPEYEREIPLEEVFPYNPKLILTKLEQITATNGQVVAAAKDAPGVKSFNFSLYPLQDMLITLDSSGRDLALLVFTENQELIGFSDLRDVDYEAILLSSSYFQTVKIVILNYDAAPANFGMKIYEIVW